MVNFLIVEFGAEQATYVKTRFEICRSWALQFARILRGANLDRIRTRHRTMKRYLLLGRTIVYPLILACVSSCHAKEPDLVSWPEAARQDVQVEFYVENTDGFDERRALLRYQELRLVLDTGKQWSHSPRDSEKFSVKLTDRLAEGVSLRIAIFEAGEFFSNLESDEEWSTYVDSVRGSKVAPEVTYLQYSKESMEPPFILNSVYRQLDYVSSTEDGIRMKTREIFAEIESRLFVFVFSGEEQVVDSLRERHNLLLSRLDLKR